MLARNQRRPQLPECTRRSLYSRNFIASRPSPRPRPCWPLLSDCSHTHAHTPDCLRRGRTPNLNDQHFAVGRVANECAAVSKQRTIKQRVAAPIHKRRDPRFSRKGQRVHCRPVMGSMSTRGLGGPVQQSADWANSEGRHRTALKVTPESPFTIPAAAYLLPALRPG